MIDEAGLAMYANRTELYMDMLGSCMAQYGEIVRGVIGAGQGLHDQEITARLLENVQAVEAMQQTVRQTGRAAAGELRGLLAEVEAADGYSWQDGGITAAGEAFAAC